MSCPMEKGVTPYFGTSALLECSPNINSCSWACQGDALETQKAFHYSPQCYLWCWDSSVVTVILEGCFLFGALVKTWGYLFLRPKLFCVHGQWYASTLNTAPAHTVFQMGRECPSYSVQTHIFNKWHTVSYILVLHPSDFKSSSYFKCEDLL